MIPPENHNIVTNSAPIIANNPTLRFIFASSHISSRKSSGYPGKMCTINIGSGQEFSTGRSLFFSNDALREGKNP
jgi:hypothetical protein